MQKTRNSEYCEGTYMHSNAVCFDFGKCRRNFPHSVISYFKLSRMGARRKAGYFLSVEEELLYLGSSNTV